MLSSKHISLPSDKDLHIKLRPKFYGPFEIAQCYYHDKHRQLTDKQRNDVPPVAYKLKLPDALSEIYPVFARSKLKAAPTSDEFISRVQPEPPPTQEVAGFQEYTVERVRDHTSMKSRLTKKSETHW
jgi:hypothetical protein